MINYSKTFEVRWADLDPNFHMRHTAYNDYAAHVRVSFLSEAGFTLKKFNEMGVGPVIFREETKFFKEVLADDKITINFQMEARSSDWRKWTIKHDIIRNDGEKAAEINIDGAWFSTKTRKVIVPPEELMSILKTLTPSFQQGE